MMVSFPLSTVQTQIQVIQAAPEHQLGVVFFLSVSAKTTEDVFFFKIPMEIIWSLAHFQRKNNFAAQFDTKDSIFPVTNHKSQNTDGLCTRLEF